MEVAQLACAAAFCKNSAVKDIMNKEGSSEAVPHLDIFSWIGWAFIKSKSEISWGNISVFSLGICFACLLDIPVVEI